LLFASKAVGKGGRVVGVDLNPVSVPLPANAEFIAGDILQWDEQVIKESLEGPFDVVLSDMAPACTGHKFVDVQRSLALCRCALSVCHSVLRPGGALVCKVFQGPDVDAFGGEVKALFSRMTHVRPKSTRKASKEVYIVGLEKKRGGEGQSVKEA
jgi:23S rRNA (uridine2552-2'-O)-methyltransferase